MKDLHFEYQRDTGKKVRVTYSDEYNEVYTEAYVEWLEEKLEEARNV